MPLALSIALSVVAVVLGGIVVTSLAGPNLAAVGMDRDQLLVRPVGLVRFWGLTKGASVPLSSVTGVGVEDRRRLRPGRPGLRRLGTYLPGVMIAGTFGRKEERSLWMVGRAKRVLVIDLERERHARLVLQVEDPEAANASLRAAINQPPEL